jgi:CotS family spore coat protein
LLNSWPLEELSQIYGIQIGNVQIRNKILYIETNIGPLALKKSTLTREELELQFAILLHLSNKGYKQFSKIISTQDNKGYAQVGEQIYSLTSWVTGYHPNFTLTNNIDLGAHTLASFHRAATGYHEPVHWQKRRLYGIWPMRFRYRLSHLQWYQHCIRARGVRNEFDQLFMEQVDHFLLQGYRVIDRLRNPVYYALATEARKQGTVCHHDFAYHNILVDPDSTAWLIDFDYCILDMQVHDLGNMISRHVKYTKWCLDDVSRILLIYHQEKALLPAELEMLVSLIEFPQDFWQVAWAKYNEVSMHRPESLLLRLKKTLENEQAKQNFLAELSDLVKRKNFLPGRDTL